MTTDVLSNWSAAQRAIPDLGYDWPNARLRALGEAVQSVYPELSGWPPDLAAEAHLLYASRSHSIPAGVAPDARNDLFLAFLRATVARFVGSAEPAVHA